MLRLTSMREHRRSGVWWLSFLLLVLTLAFPGAASATIWSPGDVITYTQGFWSDDPTASAILTNDYDSVYATTFGVLEVGIPGPSGFSIRFSDSSFVLTYLPASGPAGPLVADVVNPDTTASGVFGGDVTALQLNVDFSDAGFILGSLGLPFGDIIMANFSTLPNLNGLTVRQFLGDARICLGGGPCIDNLSDIDTVTALLNASFGAGDVSDFAQQHLVAPTAAVPEPSTMLILGSGLLGLWGARKKFRK